MNDDWWRQLIAMLIGAVLIAMPATCAHPARSGTHNPHQNPPTTTTEAPAAVPRASRVTQPPVNVEAWRPLVGACFPSELVNDAMAVIACESQGNPNAVNTRSGAAGLWQFMPDTWNWVAGNTGSPSFDEDGPYDPEWATINAWWLWQHGGPQHWTCWRMQH